MNLFKKIATFFGLGRNAQTTASVQDPHLLAVENFKKALEAKDLNAIISYLEEGGDINIGIRIEKEDNVDGEPYTWTEVTRALDLVEDSPALVKLLRAKGGKTEEEILAERRTAEAAELERLRDEWKREKELAAQREAQREAERLTTVEAYLASH